MSKSVERLGKVDKRKWAEKLNRNRWSGLVSDHPQAVESRERRAAEAQARRLIRDLLRGKKVNEAAQHLAIHVRSREILREQKRRAAFDARSAAKAADDVLFAQAVEAAEEFPPSEIDSEQITPKLGPARLPTPVPVEGDEKCGDCGGDLGVDHRCEDLGDA
jgi:hypothetical protein